MKRPGFEPGYRDQRSLALTTELSSRMLIVLRANFLIPRTGFEPVSSHHLTVQACFTRANRNLGARYSLPGRPEGVLP